MKKFKTGVSNWKLIFENGDIIDCQCLLSESVIYRFDGGICIELKNANFLLPCIDKLKQNIKIKEVEQELCLAWSEEINHREIVILNYDNLYIDSCIANGELGAIGTLNIILKNDLYKD